MLFALLIGGTSLATAAVPLTPSRKLCDSDKIKQTNACVDCLQKAPDKSEAELTALVGKIGIVKQANDTLEASKRGESKNLFEATQMKWLQLRDDDWKSFAAHTAGLGFGAGQSVHRVGNPTAS